LNLEVAMSNPHWIVASCLALVVLTIGVSMRMLQSRVNEMRTRRIHPQSASTSVLMGAKLEDVRAADNFRNLFEVPVLFYTLCAMALALGHTPGWLVAGAWVFVALRVLHSVIHCTYNKVMHRFQAFLAGVAVVLVLWIAFFVTLPVKP
jgi:hypothetical protein